jgi:hypothetical protein
VVTLECPRHLVDVACDADEEERRGAVGELALHTVDEGVVQAGLLHQLADARTDRCATDGSEEKPGLAGTTTAPACRRAPPPTLRR